MPASRRPVAPRCRRPWSRPPKTRLCVAAATATTPIAAAGPGHARQSHGTVRSPLPVSRPYPPSPLNEAYPTRSHARSSHGPVRPPLPLSRTWTPLPMATPIGATAAHGRTRRSRRRPWPRLLVSRPCAASAATVAPCCFDQSDDQRDNREMREER